MNSRDLPKFPFRAKHGSREIVITGRHYTGLLTTEGSGLVQITAITPIAGIIETRHRPAFGHPAEKPHRREWKMQGALKRPRMTRRAIFQKAYAARDFLRRILGGGPVPARQILFLARATGLSEWGVRRAKKRLKIVTIRIGVKGKFSGQGGQ